MIASQSHLSTSLPSIAQPGSVAATIPNSAISEVGKSVNSKHVQAHQLKSKLARLEQKLAALAHSSQEHRQQKSSLMSSIANKRHQIETLEPMVKGKKQILSTSRQENKEFTKRLATEHELQSRLQQRPHRVQQKIQHMEHGKEFHLKTFMDHLTNVLATDEANIGIQKLAILDEKSVKDKKRNLEKLNAELDNKKKQYEETKMELNVAKNELGRLKSESKACEIEKTKLLEQYQNAVKTLDKQDSVANKKVAEIQQSYTNAVQKEQRLFEKHVQEEAQSNKQIETYRNVNALNGVVTKLNKQIAGIQPQLDSVAKKSLYLEKTSIAKATNLANQTDELAVLERNLGAEHELLKKLQATKSSLLANLNEHGGKNGALQEISMNQLVDGAEAQNKALKKKLGAIKDTISKQKSVKDSMTFEEKGLSKEIKFLTMQEQTLFEELEKKDAIELPIVSARPDKPLTENELLVEKVAEKVAENRTYETTIQLSDHELADTKTRFQGLCSDKERLIKQKNLSTKELESLKKLEIKGNADRQAKQAENNLLMYEIIRLKHSLVSKHNDVVSVAQLSEESNSYLLDTKEFLAQKKDELQSQYVQMEDERKNWTNKQRENQTRLNQLKAKYESLASTQSKYQELKKLKSDPSEKQKLFQQEYDLDTRIQKAEQDLNVLNNALDSLKKQNETVSRSMNKPKQALKDKENELKNLQEYKQELKIQKQDQQDNINSLKKDAETLLQQNKERKTAVEQLKQQHALAAEKLSKLERDICSMQENKQGSGNKMPNGAELLQRERFYNDAILEHLKKVSDSHPDVGKKLDLAKSDLMPVVVPPELRPSRKVTRNGSLKSKGSQIAIRSSGKNLSSKTRTPAKKRGTSIRASWKF